MTITCDRSHKPNGWNELAGWWVCGTCGKPTKEWLLAQGDNDMLNYFRGGPMDGAAYETTTLLQTSALALPVHEYKWSEETVTSQVTGKTARVWIWQQGQISSEAPEQPARVQSTQEETGMAKKNTATVEERRKALKLSRAKLAAAAGISESQVWRAEQPEPSLKEGTAEAIEKVLAEFESAPVTDAPAEPVVADPA